jgi:hypothetical protein
MHDPSSLPHCKEAVEVSPNILIFLANFYTRNPLKIERVIAFYTTTYIGIILSQLVTVLYTLLAHLVI